jgi:hypothetical protein
MEVILISIFWILISATYIAGIKTGVKITVRNISEYDCKEPYIVPEYPPPEYYIFQ